MYQICQIVFIVVWKYTEHYARIEITERRPDYAEKREDRQVPKKQAFRGTNHIH